MWMPSKEISGSSCFCSSMTNPDCITAFAFFFWCRHCRGCCCYCCSHHDHHSVRAISLMMTMMMMMMFFFCCRCCVWFFSCCQMCMSGGFYTCLSFLSCFSPSLRIDVFRLACKSSHTRCMTLVFFPVYLSLASSSPSATTATRRWLSS